MGTLTALKPKPLIFDRPVVKIELVLATPEDMKIFIGYDIYKKPLYKKRVGMVYWLKSMLKNEIEASPRIYKETDDPLQIKEWLDFGMIYICKVPFL